MKKWKYEYVGHMGCVTTDGDVEAHNGMELYATSDVDAREAQSVAVIKAQRERIAELERRLDPRRWTKEESDAWHRAIPDVQAAFNALRSL